MATVLLVGAGSVDSQLREAARPSSVATIPRRSSHCSSCSRRDIDREKDGDDRRAVGAAASQPELSSPQASPVRAFSSAKPSRSARSCRQGERSMRCARTRCGRSFVPSAPDISPPWEADCSRGREFDAGDTPTSSPVIVISRSVARQYFGASSAVGQIVNWHSGFGQPSPTRSQRHRFTVTSCGCCRRCAQHVAGSCGESRNLSGYRQMLALQRLWGDSTHRQEQTSIGFLSFAIRARGNPEAISPTVGEIVRAVDPNVGIDAMIPMASLAATSIARPRFYAVLLGVFAGVAGSARRSGDLRRARLRRRSADAGNRHSHGARRAARAGARARAAARGWCSRRSASCSGVAGAAASARLLQGMLFGVTPSTRARSSSSPCCSGSWRCCAAYLPARRATQVDLTVALRARLRCQTWSDVSDTFMRGRIKVSDTSDTVWYNESMRFAVAVIAITLAACKTGSPNGPAGAGGLRVVLAPGQQAACRAAGAIRFESVTNDSRCPGDAICVWAGGCDGAGCRVRVRRRVGELRAPHCLTTSPSSIST